MSLNSRQQLRELCGSVIFALKRQFEETSAAMSEQSIARITGIDDAEDPSQFQRDFKTALHYVVAQGYAERKAHPIDAHDKDPRVTYRLTGKGLQLFQGSITDGEVDLTAYVN